MNVAKRPLLAAFSVKQHHLNRNYHEKKMDALTVLNKKDLRELLLKGWMTHDAMWLQQSALACGAEKANAMNASAIEAMALIEIQRIKKALGITKSTVETFEELSSLIEATFSVVKGDFMKFTFSFPTKNVFQWD